MWSHAVLVALHLLSAVVWIGGMAVLHFALRPVLAQQLQPPQRLPLMAAVLQRFFVAVTVAVLVLLFSGLAMIELRGGWRQQPPAVHAMAAVAVVMMALFGHIRLALFPRLQQAVAAAAWPVAGAALAGIAKLVSVNLALGVLTLTIAALGPALA